MYSNCALHLADAGHAHLSAVLNNGVRLHFDTHDAGELATDELANCDFYFKRSYSLEFIQQLPPSEQAKILPLGLNYRVLPNAFDRFAAHRDFKLNSRPYAGVSAFVRNLDSANLFGFQPRLRALEELPDFGVSPKVLFLVTAYDPYDKPTRSQEKSTERYELNEMRAACIRLMRKELGDKFFGGFNRNAHTAAKYSDLVVPDDVTIKSRYIELLRSFPICVATTGLHGSTGWKLAEYVAFGKAILSEKLLYEVPGDFSKGQNYMEFASPEQCVEGAKMLLEDPALRRRLITNNLLYYRSYVRPDALVLNALITALSQASD